MISQGNLSTSPFIVGKMVTDPTKFWGREQEYQYILARLLKMESTSIVGTRRIGKSSLAYFTYMVAPKRLGETYEFVWLDGQSNHSASVDHFFKAIANCSSLAYKSANNTNECLINFEDAVKTHSKKLVIIINELEILADEIHRTEFGTSFYNTLRLLAEQGCCALIITSYASLKDLCKHVLGMSSPFYNVFGQVTLGHFTVREANSFLICNHDDVTLTSSEIQFVQKKVKFHQHPLVLQIACDSVFENRRNGLSEIKLQKQIEGRVDHFLSHEEVQEKRRMTKKASDNNTQKINKPLDLLVSILIPVLGVGILMLEYGLLIRTLSNFQAVILALVTAILGFAILIFAGRSVDIIGESTFYKLFLQMTKQIPLISNLADNIIRVATKLREK